MAKKSEQIIVRTHYGPHNPADYAVHIDPIGLTDQSQTEDADINNIVARHQITGVYDHVAKYEPWYGDASGEDFKQAMDLVTSATSMFGDLPSETRERFDNDPAKFLDFAMQDWDNADADELCEMGVIDKNSDTYRRFSTGAAMAANSEPPADQVNDVMPGTTPPSSE